MVNKRERGFARLATLLTGILGVIALVGGLLFGQEFSAIMSGVVHDASGGLVPGVSVTAKHTESGLTRTVITNETGSYRMPALLAGGRAKDKAFALGHGPHPATLDNVKGMDAPEENTDPLQ